MSTSSNAAPEERFAISARAFCGLIESAPLAEKCAFFTECFTLLLRLCEQAIQLPDLAIQLPDLKGASRESTVASEDYKTVVTALKQQAGDHDYYRMIFDPWDLDHGEPTFGSVSDDLADTWIELKEGIAAMESGNINDAVWIWRFSFESHWGPHHATPVLRPLLSLALSAR